MAKRVESGVNPGARERRGSPDAPASSPRILIIKLSSLGDVVHALPVLTTVRNRFPTAYIAWAVEPRAEDVVRDHPLLDEVIVFDPTRWSRAMKKGPRLDDLREARRLIRLLRGRRFDTVLDVQGVFRSGVLAWLTGAKTRISYSDTREANRYFMTRLVTIDRTGRHAVESCLDVARAIGADGRPTDAIFPTTTAAHERVAAFLARQGISPEELLVVLAPSTSWPSKCWIEEGFATVGDALVQGWGARVILIGSRKEQPLIEGIAAKMQSPPLVAAGALSIKEVAALAERCDLFIGGDTGPLQIALAVGAPVVALFGPTNPALTGPLHPGSITLRGTLCIEGERCHQRVCETRECMRSISVRQVLTAAASQLARRGRRPVTAGGSEGCCETRNVS